ncbi:hypothetical protein PLICRDRAFT_110170 [Plicaturopsis crispa FD-325 SS-3]|nr:hypothetical protein PLICRDRAFT_110170 [Plicaturopsis crispa FD-325 SS-3]
MSASKCPVDHSPPAEKCPVDHSAASSSTWSSFMSKSPPAPTSSKPTLSSERETSSIPKPEGDKWVYPSEAQFFAAMERKNHNPEAADMKTIVPIHNAVNERAWRQVLEWERGRGGDACGGVRLVNFKGRPGERSPKARWKSLLGFTPPFDRHDWVVDRCGTRVRYVIDFYTGRSIPGTNGLSFFLDVRPALDNWEGVRMRVGRLWDDWFGSAVETKQS